MQEFNPNDVRLVAMNLLARREYLRKELARKLSRRFRSRRDRGSAGHVEEGVEGSIDGSIDGSIESSIEGPVEGNLDGHIEEVLEQLVAENLLSDERYTESYIRSRSGRGYGPERIRQELRQRGADSGLLENALSTLEVDWVALAREVRFKKFGGEPPVDFSNKAKQVRFLIYRGFGSEIASEALSFSDQDS